MTLQKEVVVEVVASISKIAQDGVQIGPRKVRDRFLESKLLAQFVEVDDDPDLSRSPLAGAVTIAGNAIVEGSRQPKTGTSRVIGFFKKQSESQKKQPVSELLIALPVVLEALAERLEVSEYPHETLAWLQQQKLLPEHYQYEPQLVGKLKSVAKLLPQVK